MIKKLKEVFSRNIGMKLLSFVLAFLIWVVIMSLSDPKTTKQIDGIPLEARHKDDFNNLEENKDLSIDILTTGTVSVKITGTRSELEGLNASDFVAYADFNDFVGVNAIPIKIEKKGTVPKNVEVISQSKTVMQVKLVKSASALVNVVEDIINVPDDKYAICTSMSSKLLTVTGPEEVVAKVGKLVAQIDISTMSTTTKYVELKPYDKDGNEMDAPSLELSQKGVQVEIEMLPTKDVAVEVYTDKTEVMNGFGIYKVDFSPKEVRIAASEAMLRSVTPIRLSFETDEPLMKQGKPVTKDFDLTKYLPEGVYLKSVNSVVSVNVTVEPIVEKEFTFSVEELNVQNMPEGFVLHQGADGETMITIRVTGLKPCLDLITTAADLKPSVDLKGVTKAGTQKFPIKINIDNRNISEDNLKMIMAEGEAELTIAEQ